MIETREGIDRPDAFQHRHRGKESTDVGGEIRVPARVFGERRSFSAPEALDEILSQRLQQARARIAVGSGGIGQPGLNGCLARRHARICPPVQSIFHLAFPK
jgi:hypothetical protein